MKWIDILRLSVTNLWRRKLRTILTMVGAMIGTASIVVMVSLGIGINQGYIDSLSESGELTTININSNTYYGGGGMIMVGADGSGANQNTKIDDQLMRRISALDHITVASPKMDI